MRAVVLLFWIACLATAEIRVGIIGTDTSHAIAFTKLLNDPSDPKHIRGAKVVAAFQGGSPDLPSSRDRVEKYAAELRTKWGVRFYGDIPSLARDVDAILLTSVDGRVHLAQAKLVFASGKPVFIDKPLAATYTDAKAIAELAAQSKVPWFSASSLRWVPLVQQLRSPENKAVLTWGPAELEPTHPLDLSWYGIHAVELLYAILGPGCVEVTRTVSGDVEVVTGKWKDGRLGTVQFVRPDAGFGGAAFRGKKTVTGEAPVDYAPMVAEIVRFFETGQTPIPPAETLELFAFLDAALRSKQQGGRPVRLE